MEVGDGVGVQRVLSLRVHMSEQWSFPQLLATWRGLNSLLP